VLETLWSLAKEAELSPHALLVDNNKQRKNISHVAVEENNVNLLQKIWVWGKEVQLKPNDIKKLLLAKDKDG